MFFPQACSKAAPSSRTSFGMRAVAVAQALPSCRALKQPTGLFCRRSFIANRSAAALLWLRARSAAALPPPAPPVTRVFSPPVRLRARATQAGCARPCPTLPFGLALASSAAPARSLAARLAVAALLARSALRVLAPRGAPRQCCFAAAAPLRGLSQRRRYAVALLGWVAFPAPAA